MSGHPPATADSSDGSARGRSPLLRAVLRAGALLTGARVLTGSGRFVYALLLAQWLSAGDYGRLHYALAWYIAFVPLALLGLNTLLVREAARRELSRSARRVADSLGLQLSAGALTVLLSLVLVARFEPDPSLRALLYWASCAIVGRALALWVNAILTGRESASEVFRLETAFRLLEFSVGACLAYGGADIVTLVQWHALTWTLQGGVGLWLLRRQGLRPQLRWRAAPALRLLRAGLPFLVGTSAQCWLLQGPLVLYRHAGATEAGLGALTLSLQVLFLYSAVVHDLSQAALAGLSGRLATGDSTADTRLYARFGLRAGLLLGTFYAVLSLSVLPEALRFAFGPDYRQTVQTLPLLALTIVPWFWMQSLSSLHVAQDRYGPVLLGSVAGAISLTLLTLLPFGNALQGVLLAIAAGTLVAASGVLHAARAELHALLLPLPFCIGALIATLLLAPRSATLAALGGASVLGAACTIELRRGRAAGAGVMPAHENTRTAAGTERP